MCGISGILSIHNADLLRYIKFMTDCLSHRGPDDEGFVFFKPKESFYHCFGSNDTPADVFSVFAC